MLNYGPRENQQTPGRCWAAARTTGRETRIMTTGRETIWNGETNNANRNRREVLTYG